MCKELEQNAPLEALPAPLLAWFRRGARDLPWRHTCDPYPIWVSEIMLQQTRVAAVLGYYARFLDAFPTVRHLADAPEDLLLKQWEGLGYYSRARNLQKAARIIVENGGFPRDYAGLLALPGIGDYTASAIASAAYGQREAAVDGNALRVVMRLTDCHDDITDPKVKRAVRDRLQAVMPPAGDDCRIFNQAVMELGATLCGPKGSPDCGQCPCAGFCRGLAKNTVDCLPVKSKKKPRRIEEKTVFLLLRGKKLALRKRPASGLLAGLWEFPNTDGTLNESDAAQFLAARGLTVSGWENRLAAKHMFTHVEWHMTGYTVTVSGDGPQDLVWVDAGGLEAHAVPSAFARYYQEAASRLSTKEDTP